MSFFSRITGQDARRNRAATRSIDQWGAGNDPNDQYRKAILSEQQGGGWEDAFNKTAGAYVQGQLPQLRNSLQMSREDAIRRGISTGDLQTTNEGDITSAWGKNISNTLGGMAMQGYENNQNRYLDLLTGQIDRTTNAKNQTQNNWMSVLNGIIQGGAKVAGAYAGKP